MSESEKLEESTEAEIFVADPEDYAKTRKIKAINDAKQQVRKLRKDRPVRAKESEWEGRNARFAEAVAFYGSELLPIIRKAIDMGSLDESCLQTEAGNIEDFIVGDGTILEDEGDVTVPKRTKTMVYYRQLDSIQQEMGLGLELEENKGPAEI